MIKYVVFAVIVNFGVLVFAAPSETSKVGKINDFKDCVNNTEAHGDFGLLVNVRGSNATREDKCIASCLLNKLGTLSSTGEIKGNPVAVFFTLDDEPADIKQKVDQIAKECVESASTLTDMCEKGFSVKECVLSKTESLARSWKAKGA